MNCNGSFEATESTMSKVMRCRVVDDLADFNNSEQLWISPKFSLCVGTDAFVGFPIGKVTPFKFVSAIFSRYFGPHRTNYLKLFLVPGFDPISNHPR